MNTLSVLGDIVEVISQIPTVVFARELWILSILLYLEQSELLSFRTITLFSEIANSDTMGHFSRERERVTDTAVL